MDDKEDRDVTLQEQLNCLNKRITDAVIEYNSFLYDNRQDLFLNPENCYVSVVND